MQPHPDDDAPADLSHAGAVVDKAIEYMMGQNIATMSIASALLGGSMALLTRCVGEDAVVQILNNAIASVRAGELRQGDDAEAEDDAGTGKDAGAGGC